MNKCLISRMLLLTSACLAVGLTSTKVPAGTIDEDLQRAMQTGEDIDFIVRFKDQLDLRPFPGRGKGKGVQLAGLLWELRNQADSSQRSAVALLRGNGAKKLVQLWSINAMAVTATPETIEQLAVLSEVDSIQLDDTFSAPSPEPAAASTPEWNLQSIRAPELWNAGYDGTGTIVASLDTGVDIDHPDLAAAWRNGANSWFDPNGEHSTPYDKSGHGTQTMSLMVGGDAGGTSIGVSPGAQWIAVKVFNDAGVASLSAIHQGFQWLLDPDGNPATNDIPDVVNNSWGFPDLVGQCYTEFDTDMAVLKAAGIAVVFSGGNQGQLGSVSPGDNPESFAVGAVDSSMNVAATSSRGPSACDGSFFPEIVAPGVSIRVADLTFGGVFLDSYTTVSGTSFSAPHVAGTMALLRQSNPDTSAADLEQALLDSAVDLGITGADDDYGYGIIDAVAAYDVLASNPPPLCTDFDGDGFFVEADCGSLVDCNDFDPAINPAVCDIKRDGIDQDCDGVDRRRGKSCPVVLEDTIAPVITLLGTNPLNITVGATYAEPGATAIDAVDGVVAVSNTGIVDTNVAGTYTVTYTATDAAGNTATTTRTVNVVASGNEAPVAVVDTSTVQRRTKDNFIHLTGNDSDIDGNLKTPPFTGDVSASQIDVKSAPNKGGKVTVVTNGVNYTPKRNFRGEESFSYTVKDLAGATSNEVTVRVNVVR